MKILIDTNILISTLLFPKSKVAKTVLYITEHHEMVLKEQNVTELCEVLNRKKPELLFVAQCLLEEMSYELIPVKKKTENVRIRDAKDQPILNAAIEAGIDIVLTGDKDFLSLDLKYPKCLSVSEFLEIEEINF